MFNHLYVVLSFYQGLLCRGCLEMWHVHFLNKQIHKSSEVVIPEFQWRDFQNFPETELKTFRCLYVIWNHFRHGPNAITQQIFSSWHIVIILFYSRRNNHALFQKPGPMETHFLQFSKPFNKRSNNHSI